MLYALLFLSILFTSAQATTHLRLVEQIQLPARTVTWDVQHVEDSTSYGWAAITQGASIWGSDSLHEDSLISLGVDTIWHSTNSGEAYEHILFTREQFNPWQDDLHWHGLRLFSMPSVPGVSAVARAIDGWSETYDQYLYFFHISGDSVLTRRQISWGSDDSEHLIGIEVWPPLPHTAEFVLAFRSRHYRVEHAGCDESTTIAYSGGFRLPEFTAVSVPGLKASIFDRSDTINLA